MLKLQELLISLEFEDKSISKIVGFILGEEIYNKQGKHHIFLTACNIINLPKYIDYVGSSFIQVFITSLLDRMGNKDKLLEHIKFRSENKFVEDKIYRDIYMWIS